MQNDREYYSLLLDYYGDLLTRHQVEILSEYYNEDLSMNEIAENLKISKSAVQDLIKRTIKQLDDYEKALRMVRMDKLIEEQLAKMKAEGNEILDKYVDKIRKIMK